MRYTVIIVGMALFAVPVIFAQDHLSEYENNWPQFRGSMYNQLPPFDTLPVEWSVDKNLQWQYNVPGRGWSSPVIWGNRVFISTAVTDEPNQTSGTIGPQGGSNKSRTKKPTFSVSYELHCLDLNTGHLLWKRVAHKGLPHFVTHPGNTYASETPVTDGQRVYVYYGALGLYCYDIEGNFIWKKELGKYVMDEGWGTSTSPLLHGNLVYMQIDSEDMAFLVALDSATGNERWRVIRNEKTNLSTPIIWKNTVRTELVTGGQITRAYEPESGALLWELALGGGRSVNSPVANERYLYLGNEERKGGGILFSVKAGATGDITPQEGAASSDWVAWSLPKAGLSIASPVLYNDFIYLVDRRGSFINCIDAVSGQPYYQRKRVPQAKAFFATPWVYDDKLFCVDDAGTTHVIPVGPELKVLYRNSISEKIWSSAAFAEGTIVLRGVNNVYCIR